MEPMPESGASGVTVERLAGKVIASGLHPADLDDLVHELASTIAADVNNGGLEDQIAYLVGGMGVEHTARQLDQLIEKHPFPQTKESDRGRQLFPVLGSPRQPYGARRGMAEGTT